MIEPKWLLIDVILKVHSLQIIEHEALDEFYQQMAIAKKIMKKNQAVLKRLAE
jgi:hypothetical protein